MQKLKTDAEACLKESHADKELVQKLFTDHEFTEDNNLKCFVKCLYLKLNFMSESGEFDAAEIQKNVHSVNGAVIERCTALKGTDLCDTAFIVAKCVVQSN